MGDFSSYNYPADLVKRLSNFRVFNTFLREFQSELDLDIIKDFFSWPKGSFYFAIVRTDDTSPVAGILARTRDIGTLKECRSRLHRIAEGLDTYYQEKERYPRRIEELGDTLQQADECPSGGVYHYQTNTDCTIYTIECRNEHRREDSSAYRLRYTSERGMELKESSPEMDRNASLNIAMVVPVKDHDLARASVEKMMTRFQKRERVSYRESSYGGYTIFSPTGRIKASFALGRSFLIMTDNPEIITIIIDTMGRKRSALHTNPRYLSYKRNLPDASTMSFFADMQKIVECSKEPLSTNAKTCEFLRSCESLGGWATLQRKQIRGETILTLGAGKVSGELDRLKKGAGEDSLVDLLKIFPQNISNFAAADILDLMKVFGTLTLPDQKADIEEVAGEFTKKNLGLSWEDDVKPALSGRAGISYEFGECMADMLLSKLSLSKSSNDLERCCTNLANIGIAIDISALDHRSRLPSDLQSLAPNYLNELPACPAGGVYAYEAKGSSYSIRCTGNAHKDAGIRGDNPCYLSPGGLAGNTPEGPSKGSKASAIPFLLGLEVKDMGRAQKIINRIGGGRIQFFSQEYKEKKIFVANDGSSAYAFVGNLLLLEIGNRVPCKIEKTIDAISNSRNALSQSKSFRRFQGRLSGKTLFVSRDRIDWISSLLKSFLLLAGSDFREWAEVVGEYEDCWSALTVNGRELRLVFDISAD
jgi:hypothetical protein